MRQGKARHVSARQGFFVAITKEIEFEMRGSKIVARRMADDLGWVQTEYSCHPVPEGDWIVKFVGTEWEFPCTHLAAKTLFRPVDKSLRQRWDESK